MLVTRDERGGVGVRFFRSGRTRLEFTAIRAHNGHALDQVQRSRPNFSDLTRLSSPQRPLPRLLLLVHHASSFSYASMVSRYHHSFFNILLSSYEDEARENARLNRVK